MTSYRLDRWDDIRYFLAVARAGSCHGAGERLGISQSSVSRRIQYLEKRLGAHLFIRNSRGFQLTSLGSELMAYAENMERSSLAIERHVAGADRQMAGLVRISAPEGVISHYLVPVLQGFRQQYPMVQVDLMSGTSPIDLAAHQADVAIRTIFPTTPGTVATRATELHYNLFAAPAYLERHGAAQGIDDLGRHWLVDHVYHRQYIKGWGELISNHTNVAGRFDSSSAYVSAVKSGYGIGLLPFFYRIVERDLVALPIETRCHAPIYILSHEETKDISRIRKIIGFITSRMHQDRFEWFGEK